MRAMSSACVVNTDRLLLPTLEAAALEALRDHLARSDQPLPALALIARDLAATFAKAARRFEGAERDAMENVAADFAAAVERIWRDLGGDPDGIPARDLKPG